MTDDLANGWNDGGIVPTEEMDFDAMDQRNGWAEEPENPSAQMPEGRYVIDPATLRFTLSAMEWARQDKAKLAAIRILFNGDRRPVREVASEYRVNARKVYAAIRALRSHLGSLPLMT